MARTKMLLGACILAFSLTGVPVAAQGAADPIPIGSIAEKLGVTLIPSSPKELELGHSATTMLAKPTKLVPYGISGMHEGARVTITCVGPNRVRVEADELEPVSHRASVTLQVSNEGELKVVADRPASAPKPPPM